MSIYDEFRELAADLLDNEFGVPAQLTRITPGIFNKVTGKQTAGTVATSTVNTVLLNSEVTGENGAITVATQCILNVEAKAGDKLVLAGNSYIIDSVEILQPDGQGFCWQATLRSGA